MTIVLFVFPAVLILLHFAPNIEVGQTDTNEWLDSLSVKATVGLIVVAVGISMAFVMVVMSEYGYTTITQAHEKADRPAGLALIKATDGCVLLQHQEDNVRYPDGYILPGGFVDKATVDATDDDHAQMKRKALSSARSLLKDEQPPYKATASELVATSVEEYHWEWDPDHVFADTKVFSITDVDNNDPLDPAKFEVDPNRGRWFTVDELVSIVNSRNGSAVGKIPVHHLALLLKVLHANNTPPVSPNVWKIEDPWRTQRRADGRSQPSS
jgi:hypothetical protein